MNTFFVERYWHRSLNVKKLLSVKFSHLGRNMTVQRMEKLYRLPEVNSEIFHSENIFEEIYSIRQLKPKVFVKCVMLMFPKHLLC